MTIKMKKTETTIFALLILAINLPMLLGGSSAVMAYSPAAVNAGHYWCLLTHPFAHVSIYHLVIDVSAFFLLLGQLKEPSTARRIAYLFCCGLLSLVAIRYQLLRDGIEAYCGLSGIDHGLMAICALESIHGDRQLRKSSIVMLTILAIKCVIEICSGSLLLAALHPGNVGIPVAMSHAGGLAGGITGFYLLNLRQITAGLFSDKSNTSKCKTV